jgi:hypothetical protein
MDGGWLMLRDDWTRYIYALNVDSNKKVVQLDFNLKVEDVVGKFNVTDLQVQGGTQVTAHTPHTSEILERVKHGIDEKFFEYTVTDEVVHDGMQPRQFTGLKNRFYNIVGRGHEVLAFPNVFHEDYTEDLVTSALNIVLHPKNDYDLLRIRTNDGAYVENRYNADPTHPLNMKYTREFYFEGGKLGDEIKLEASIFSASLQGVNKPLAQGNLTFGSYAVNTRQRYMMAPWGSFRIGVEFYKLVGGIYKDVGIGYWGYAEFEQYKGRATY